jgi:hypothetical protein
LVSWPARDGTEQAFRLEDGTERELTISTFSTPDGSEHFRDTALPQGPTLGYRVESADDATATCDLMLPDPSGGPPQPRGEEFTVAHPCAGAPGGPAPPIMPDPNGLQVMDGATLGIPEADFACGGVSPVIREELVSRAIHVLNDGVDFFVVVLPGDTVVDGALTDPSLNPLGTAEVVDHIAVLDIGDAVLDLIEEAPQQAVSVLEGTELGDLISIDAGIVDALVGLPQDLLVGRDLPLDILDQPPPV